MDNITNSKKASRVWTDDDIDSAYLMGGFNVSSIPVDEESPFPTIDMVSSEIERLKRLGFDRPYQVVEKLKYGTSNQEKESTVIARILTEDDIRKSIDKCQFDESVANLIIKYLSEGKVVEIDGKKYKLTEFTS